MSSTSTKQSEDRISAIAYGLWLAEGRPDGRAEAHWFKANELVHAEAAVSNIAKPKRALAAAKKAPPRKRS